MKGFSLIEMLVVVTILGIVAMMAAPSLLLGHARQQVVIAIGDLTRIRTDLSTLMTCGGSPSNLNTLPQYNYSMTTPQALCASGVLNYTQGMANGRYVSALSLNGLTLTAQMSQSALQPLRGKTLTMTANEQGAALAWSCAFSDPLFTPFSCN